MTVSCVLQQKKYKKAREIGTVILDYAAAHVVSNVAWTIEHGLQN